jgi:hypothetical protein
MQTMNTLKPTQSHVEPLIASIQSFKIAFTFNPSKYPIIIVSKWKFAIAEDFGGNARA